MNKVYDRESWLAGFNAAKYAALEPYRLTSDEFKKAVRQLANLASDDCDPYSEDLYYDLDRALELRRDLHTKAHIEHYIDSEFQKWATNLDKGKEI